MIKHPGKIKNKIKLGFTMGEALVALVFIGFIAVYAIPTLNNQIKWAQYSSLAKKSKNSP